MSASRPGTAALTASLLLFHASPALADYKDAYKKGLDALSNRRWQEAARSFQQAAGEQPREGERIRSYGVRMEEYLPHHQLGLALAKLGDCEGAVKAWRESESQGAVQKTSHYEALQRGRDACQAQLAQAKPKPSAGPDPVALARAAITAESEVERAREKSQAVEALASNPALAAVWAGDDALGPSQKRAADALAAARLKLELGRGASDLAQLAEARELAARSAQQLDGVHKAASARLEDRRRAEMKPVATPSPETKPVVAPVAPVTSAPAPAKPEPAPILSAAAPPPELIDAARAFFQGRYESTLERLENVRYPARRAAAQASLFRAAARYALFVIGSLKDDALRRAAAEDVKACRRLDPALVPDAQAFSPRFREFFEKGS